MDFNALRLKKIFISVDIQITTETEDGYDEDSSLIELSYYANQNTSGMKSLKGSIITDKKSNEQYAQEIEVEITYKDKPTKTIKQCLTPTNYQRYPLSAPEIY